MEIGYVLPRDRGLAAGRGGWELAEGGGGGLIWGGGMGYIG